ncbi:LacI family DNA-binding transcriptional regulator [Allomeiothermus silvanus]|uniref:LacI family DNA-binding transcriptional regulator n=1 Tax=Allomeiothermus silvanus TaxID=52022 RepID=UPI0023F171D4|nr:LacI family DNA-binding transcriptional regulator [Allomeiothermus silvanus]
MANPARSKRSRNRIHGIRAVAEAAGVSISTVSRALRGYSDVNPQTRQRVQEAAAALGYQPNPIGQSLVLGRSGYVAVLFSRRHSPALLDRFYAEVLGGIEAVLEASGLSLLLVTLQSADVERRLTSRGRVDGVVALGCDIPLTFLRTLHRSGLPLVLVDQPGWGPVPAVTVDNEAGAHVATRHLLLRGRRRVAFIAESLSDSNFALRKKGYERALREAGLPRNRALIAEGEPENEGGYLAAKRLLTRCLPDGLVAANDAAALSAMRALREAGLHIPEDIAVVGFDDLELARYVYPPLSTVHVPRLQMGKLGAELLLRRIAGESPPSVVLPVELIERGTT